MVCTGVKRIKSFDLPECPYCGESVDYAEAFLIKNRPLYKCKSCEKISEVRLSSNIFQVLTLSEILALSVFLITIILGRSFCFLGLALITITAIGFYGYSPFAVRLLPFKKIKKKITKTNAEPTVFEKTKKESGKDTDTEIFSN